MLSTNQAPHHHHPYYAYPHGVTYHHRSHHKHKHVSTGSKSSNNSNPGCNGNNNTNGGNYNNSLSSSTNHSNSRGIDLGNRYNSPSNNNLGNNNIGNNNNSSIARNASPKISSTNQNTSSNDNTPLPPTSSTGSFTVPNHPVATQSVLLEAHQYSAGEHGPPQLADETTPGIGYAYSSTGGFSRLEYVYQMATPHESIQGQQHILAPGHHHHHHHHMSAGSYNSHPTNNHQRLQNNGGPIRPHSHHHHLPPTALHFSQGSPSISSLPSYHSHGPPGPPTGHHNNQSDAYIMSSPACFDQGSSTSSGDSSSLLFRRRTHKSSTPANQKDATYWIRRRKNNESAKLSRLKRRVFEINLERQMEDMARENSRLQQEVRRLRDRCRSSSEDVSGILPPNTNSRGGLQGFPGMIGLGGMLAGFFDSQPQTEITGSQISSDSTACVSMNSGESAAYSVMIRREEMEQRAALRIGGNSGAGGGAGMSDDQHLSLLHCSGQNTVGGSTKHKITHGNMVVLQSQKQQEQMQNKLDRMTSLSKKGRNQSNDSSKGHHSSQKHHHHSLEDEDLEGDEGEDEEEEDTYSSETKISGAPSNKSDDCQNDNNDDLDEIEDEEEDRDIDVTDETPNNAGGNSRTNSGQCGGNGGGGITNSTTSGSESESSLYPESGQHTSEDKSPSSGSSGSDSQGSSERDNSGPVDHTLYLHTGNCSSSSSLSSSSGCSSSYNPNVNSPRRRLPPKLRIKHDFSQASSPSNS